MPKRGNASNRELTMNSTRFQRREFLKAAGVSIALPSLESFAAPANNAAPMRMV